MAITPDCKSGTVRNNGGSIPSLPTRVSLVIETWRERREKITSVSVRVITDYSPLVALVDSYGSAMTKN